MGTEVTGALVSVGKDSACCSEENTILSLLLDRNRLAVVY
jgi:hypothetical protein